MPLDARRALARYARRIGVVIGVDDYQGHFPPLESAVDDAHRVAVALEAMGFDEVRELTKDMATGAAILNALEQELPSRAGVNDLVVVYFAGHGHTVGTDGYILPADATRDVLRTGISLQRMKEASLRIKALHVIYLMDSCFSGRAFGRASASGPTDPNAFWSTSSRLVEVIAAGRENETARETDTGGLFTNAVIAGMVGGADVNGDLIVSGRELAGYVSARVTAMTGGGQHPQWGLIEGDGSVALVDRRRLPPGASANPPERETIPGFEQEISRIHAAMDRHDWRDAERFVRDLALRLDDAEIHLLLAEIYLSQDGLAYTALIEAELRRMSGLPLRGSQASRMFDLGAALEKLRRPQY